MRKATQDPMNAGINLNPYQGLKHLSKHLALRRNKFAGINLNPYQGLKLFLLTFSATPPGRNQPKSLSGIETKLLLFGFCSFFPAGINLNPYQGLKPE